MGVIVQVVLGILFITAQETDRRYKTDGSPIGDVRRTSSAVETVQAPLEVLKTKHAAVPVRINGKGPLRLVFDTGSPITFVRASAAEKIGLITKKQAEGFSLGGLR